MEFFRTVSRRELRDKVDEHLVQNGHEPTTDYEAEEGFKSGMTFDIVAAGIVSARRIVGIADEDSGQPELVEIPNEPRGDAFRRHIRMQEIGAKRVGVYSYHIVGAGCIGACAFWIDDKGAWHVEDFEGPERAIDRALDVIFEHRER